MSLSPILTLSSVLTFVICAMLSFYILHRMRIFTTSGVFFASQHVIPEKDKNGIIEVGGVAIFPILIITLCFSLGLSRLLEYYHIMSFDRVISGDRILQVLAGCGILYIIGLKNDVHGTFSRSKLLALMVATAIFPISGLWISDLQGILGIGQLSPWVGIPLTMILSLYITESIVLLDDIDGLGMGIATILLAIFLGFSFVYGFILGTMVSAAGLGVVLPYTLYKMFHPAWKKTLVGNAGSYVVGYILCYLSLALIAPAGIEMPNGTVMIVLGILLVPMFDLLRTLRTRVRQGRSVLTADRNMMQHRFIRMGVPSRWAPVCILALILLFASINTGWVLLRMDLTTLFLVDVSLWLIIQVIIHRRIYNRETKEDKQQWVITYGREAWEADKPIEKIKRKHEVFGIMGLAPQYILGDETDFIPDGMSSAERNIKRLCDLLASAVLLVIFSPLFALCYVMIRLDDHGPAIYRQERIGRFGRPFYIYKFRTMRVDAEKDGPALSHSGGEHDSRLTRVGKFLRAHHLDELPQLWNVFTGDMSFIGYRPERKFFIDRIVEHDPRYAFLYQIRPGVTSYATLYNGYTDTMEKMLRRLNYDLYYLEHRSFWFDMRILWNTFLSIIFGKEF